MYVQQRRFVLSRKLAFVRGRKISIHLYVCISITIDQTQWYTINEIKLLASSKTFIDSTITNFKNSNKIILLLSLYD
ncbi:hypothetical protein V1478_007301 [Vespula squamosa]|uniref:Uncharacterized protein n=1 Tax=Vespula squamosa TaxID=30214 RepID=A0ABD2B2X2_VESSQ